MESAEFRDRVGEYYTPRLALHGYAVRADLSALDEEEGPDCTLVWWKPLALERYGFVALEYTRDKSTEAQHYALYLARHGRDAFYQAMPEQSDLCGYLPNASQYPLLLGRYTTADYLWSFADALTLQISMQAIWQRLNSIVLPWIDAPYVSQTLWVERSWYGLALHQYLTGTWSRDAAYASLAVYRSPALRIGMRGEDHMLVMAITRLLSDGTIDPAIDRDELRYGQYLLDCVEGRRQFHIQHTSDSIARWVSGATPPPEYRDDGQ